MTVDRPPRFKTGISDSLVYSSIRGLEYLFEDDFTGALGGGRGVDVNDVQPELIKSVRTEAGRLADVMRLLGRTLGSINWSTVRQ